MGWTRRKSQAEKERVRERKKLEANYNFSEKAIYVILECSEGFLFPLNKYVELLLYG